MEEQFAPDATDEAIRRERAKARLLRGSPWWRRKCARGFCHYCGVQVKPADLTMDHLIPLIRGGQSVKGNLVPACKTCNNHKRNQLPMEWGFLD
jgi:5-methylcytosine-specific restriction endonuclease McrA